MVYCRLTAKHRAPTRSEGTHDVRSPTVRAHASPHDVAPVASTTRATSTKQNPERMLTKARKASAGTKAARAPEKEPMPNGKLMIAEPTMALTRLAVEAVREDVPCSSGTAVSSSVGRRAANAGCDEVRSASVPSKNTISSRPDRAGAARRHMDCECT